MKKFAGWFCSNIERITYMYSILILSCYLKSLGADMTLFEVFMSFLFALLFAYSMSHKPYNNHSNDGNHKGIKE